MRARIAVDQDRLSEFCRRHHIHKLAFFGSVLRDDFASDSDVDVLYEFEEGFAPGWEITAIEEELTSILGRKVDLVPFKYLNPRIKDHILSDAEIIYAR